jgi:hypothetical protein
MWRPARIKKTEKSLLSPRWGDTFQPSELVFPARSITPAFNGGGETT